MGLRINTNISSMTALRQLNIANSSLARSMERLSTGMRINSAADDPSGLVISEQLRAQINSLQQASDNAANATNLLQTGEAALNEMNAILISIRESAIYAMNTGGASAEQIAAEQSSVDQAIEAIDRIAPTTRFATRSLFNGESGFDLVTRPPELTDLNPISMNFDPTQAVTTFNLQVTQAASQASFPAVDGAGAATTGGPVTLRVTGPLGTQDVTIPDAADINTMASVINLWRDSTGVFVDTTSGEIITEEFGSAIQIRLEQVAGPGTFLGAAGAITQPGEFVSDNGLDVQANLNGVNVTGIGNHMTVVSSVFAGTLDLAEGTPTGTYDFEYRQSGLTFQLSNQTTANDTAVIGLPALYAANLGRLEINSSGERIYGFLSTLSSGAPNDLFNNPENAIRVIDTAIDQISGVRAYIGAFVNDNIEPTMRELAVHMENLRASESTIRDVDIAAESAELARTQVLFQAGVSVMAQANQLPAAILQRLQ